MSDHCPLGYLFGMGVSEKRCLVILVPEGPNYVPHRRGGGHIVFGADPVGGGVSVDVGVTLSFFHDISCTGWWILTKFAWM